MNKNIKVIIIIIISIYIAITIAQFFTKSNMYDYMKKIHKVELDSITTDKDKLLKLIQKSNDSVYKSIKENKRFIDSINNNIKYKLNNIQHKLNNINKINNDVQNKIDSSINDSNNVINDSIRARQKRLTEIENRVRRAEQSIH